MEVREQLVGDSSLLPPDFQSWMKENYLLCQLTKPKVREFYFSQFWQMKDKDLNSGRFAIC